MRNHHRVIQLMNEALKQRRCAFSTIRSENAALRRRALGDDADLLRPARGLYIPVSYWNGLTPEERTMHIARAFAAWHPTWIFGGNVAAAVHGLDGSWKMHDGTVTIVSSFQQSFSPMAKVRRTYIPEGMMKTQVVDGVTVLDKISTVLNCASHMNFRWRLPSPIRRYDRGWRVRMYLRLAVVGIRCMRMSYLLCVMPVLPAKMEASRIVGR